MKTLDQQRAAHALERTEAAEKLRDDEKKKYGRSVKKLPVRILTAGLGPALMFLRSKRDAPALESALDDWLKQRRPLKQGEPEKLLERVTKGDSTFLQFSTAESLGYLQWLGRWAEAKGLKGDD